MTDSTPDRPALIARVRELDAEATPGPWREAARSKDGDESRFEMGQPWVCTTWLLLSKTDAALIAYYRTAAPALADECERLRERVAELEEALRECLGAATDGRYLGGAGARAGCAIVETCARAALAKGDR